MEYIKKNLGSYNIHLIKNDNFKGIIVKVLFKEKIKKENITIRNFLTSLLVYSSKNYNTKRKMEIERENLYDAGIYSESGRIGNYLSTSISLSVLNDNYTEKGNFEKALKFFSEVILNPNVSDFAFDEKTFNIIMNDVALKLTSVKENKASYSVIRCLEESFKDSPIGYRGVGYLEDLKKITKENLLDYYNYMLKNDDMDIFVIGDIDILEMDKSIRKYFKSRKYKKREEDFIIEHKKKRLIPKKIIEKDNSNQSKLVLAYKLMNLTDFERNYVLSLYNIILGGGPDSKLFKDVREKNSLCYTIGTNISKLDNLMLLRAGITRNNYEKTLKLINKNVKNMSKGKFSLEDINSAVEMYSSSLKTIVESEEELIGTYYIMDLLKTDPIDKRLEKMKEVTKEDIINLSKKIKLETIYMLEGVK